MTGEIYDIPIQGYTQNLPHPHAVVLELDKECYLVPAFTAGGAELAERAAAFEAAGYPASHIWAEFDNADHVTWADSRRSNRACWVVARAKKVAKTTIRAFPKSGTMDNAGILKIASTLLTLAEVRSELFSPHFVRKMKKRVQELEAGAAADSSPSP